MRVPGEGYSRNMLCALNWISMFLFSRQSHKLFGVRD